jgi:hypothetical protein
MFTTGTATDYADLLDRLNTYLISKGSAFGLTYSGTGNGTLTAYSGGASSVAETFTITATSPTSFTVVGSTTGSIGPATVGTPFAHATIEFLLTAGGTAFVSGDAFILSTAPKWTALRKALGVVVLASDGNTGVHGAQNLVDGKNELSDRYWRADGPYTDPQEVEFEFFEAETIASYQLSAFSTSYPSYMPTAWKLQYWTGSAWSDLDTVTGETNWGATEVRTFTVTSPVSATRYRLHLTAFGTTGFVQIGAVRLLRSDGVDAAFSQTIWEAPGNDGDSEILVGVHGFERQDADYYNWEVASFDAYQATSLWREQAGHHSELYVPLWDNTIPYWFIVDGRRVIVIAKVSTQYEVAYLGLISPFFSPEQWPYPIALGGSMAFGPTRPAWNSTDWRWSNASVNHRAFTHSDCALSSNTEPEWHQMRARNLSGEWLGFASRANDGGPYLEGRGVIWPYSSGLTLVDKNIDGSYTHWPIMLNAPTPNTIGELSGVACVSGQGLTAETLIQDGAIDWMALQDIFRTDRDDFFAIALD